MAFKPQKGGKAESGEPSWKWRRLIIYAVLIWACYQLYLLINADDTKVNESLAWGWQMIVMVLVLGYTGFATAQDVVAIWTTRTARPYAEPQQEPTPYADPPTIIAVEENEEK